MTKPLIESITFKPAAKKKWPVAKTTVTYQIRSEAEDKELIESLYLHLNSRGYAPDMYEIRRQNGRIIKQELLK